MRGLYSKYRLEANISTKEHLAELNQCAVFNHFMLKIDGRQKGFDGLMRGGSSSQNGRALINRDTLVAKSYIS